MPFIILILIIFLSACNDDTPRYNGYIDADLTYLSSNYAGRLAMLSVKRGEVIHENQLLFKVDQADNDFAIKISKLEKSNLIEHRNELINQIKYEELNYKRTVKMHRDDAASQNDVELSAKNVAVLKNKLAGIDAQIISNEISTADKKWARKQKEGYSAQKGVVFDTYFTKDEFVQPGQPVLSLLTNENIKVVFFIPETQLSSTALNGRIRLFSNEQEIGVGNISYISKIAQYTPPIIYSREDSHNLVFRVEARIYKPNLNKIHLGQPISLELIS